MRRPTRCWQRGDAGGVFQFEGQGMRDVLRQMRPDRFEDLIAAVALYRPGPMANIPDYCRRKHGETWEAPHPGDRTTSWPRPTASWSTRNR